MTTSFVHGVPMSPGATSAVGGGVAATSSSHRCSVPRASSFSAAAARFSVTSPSCMRASSAAEMLVLGWMFKSSLVTSSVGFMVGSLCYTEGRSSILCCFLEAEADTSAAIDRHSATCIAFLRPSAAYEHDDATFGTAGSTCFSACAAAASAAASEALRALSSASTAAMSTSTEAERRSRTAGVPLRDPLQERLLRPTDSCTRP